MRSYSRVCGNQIVEHSLDNETVHGSSQKLGGAAEHLIDSSDKCICQLSFECYSLHVLEKHSNIQALVIDSNFIALKGGLPRMQATNLSP